ncbi:protein kinase [bacterium]|nr:protein kinase [bacterium]
MSKDTPAPKIATLDSIVVNPLGNGAGSQVLLISDRTTGQRYALKIAKRDDEDDNPTKYIDQTRREFEAAQKLNHPVIVKIYDYAEKKGMIGLFKPVEGRLLMEYVKGKTIDEVEMLKHDQLVLIFIQVAAAMAHMHRRGVYHGDLKPSNIMLSDSGKVKLIDLGTCWIKGEKKNRIQGTPQYMAPEQIADKIVNERTDVYNLGATMYKLFTGVVPSVSKKLKQPIEINPKIPGSLNDLIMKCMTSNPDHRPAGMFEIQNQLSAIAKHMGVSEADLKGANSDV